MLSYEYPLVSKCVFITQFDVSYNMSAIQYISLKEQPSMGLNARREICFNQFKSCLQMKLMITIVNSHLKSVEETNCFEHHVDQ